jgi:hypothetical protein
MVLGCLISDSFFRLQKIIFGAPGGLQALAEYHFTANGESMILLAVR